MRTIKEYINDYLIDEELMDIDSNIVCESFQCDLLQELAQQLKDQKDNEKKKNDDEYAQKLKEYEEKGWGKPYHNSTVYSQVFKRIFGGYEGRIEWHNITDKDISKIPAGEGKDKNLEKSIRDVLRGNKCNIILVKDKEDEKFLYVIFTNGNMYALTDISYDKHAGSHMGYGAGRKWRDLPQKDKIEICQGKNLYFIDAKQAKDDYNKKVNDRYQAKQGMIMFDPDSLRRIAEENIKRYKEIIRKNAASKKNNDALLEECEKIIKRAAELATEVAKNPVVNADLIGDVSSLCAWIYDERTSSFDKYSKKYVYHGVPGILRTMVKYTRLVKDIAKDGGYEHQQTELKACEAALNQGVQKGKEIIAKIEEML